ncbi:uncharacterized protein LOC113086211 isoform X1 [Carassius auratus]|uniref:Uncharacterized protein LOC113086211 isoform X1 n=1 Tax=Carassius auratus TaxID=7957 RepID=A0A6P6NRD7_CARAU|nr:uncharacterized protein LOC113086211 isoform X1 [Carassius auratus]
MASRVNNHFGFGRHAFAITFIHPHLFSKTRGRMYKAVLHQQQSLAFIISICLLLSGDIHQCPGPVSPPTRTGPHVSSIYSRSNIGNLQVCSSSHCYALEQPTDIPASVSSVGDVDLSVVGVVAAVGVSALDGECGLFRRSGVFCGGSRSVLEGNQGDVVGPDGVPAVQRRSPCGCDDAGGDLTIQKLLQSQSHFTEGNAGTGSLATIGNSTKQISCLLYIWPRTSDEN